MRPNDARVKSIVSLDHQEQDDPSSFSWEISLPQLALPFTCIEKTVNLLES